MSDIKADYVELKDFSSVGFGGFLNFANLPGQSDFATVIPPIREPYKDINIGLDCIKQVPVGHPTNFQKRNPHIEPAITTNMKRSFFRI